MLDGNGRQITTIEQVRLNVYCSANPRNRLGGTKSGTWPSLGPSSLTWNTFPSSKLSRESRSPDCPTPTMIVNSGHGVHLYWRLVEPITDLAAWKSFQKRLIQLLGSDPAIHDPPRMMRLPGFENLNGVPAPCRIIDADGDRRYSLAEIDSVLPPARTPVRPSSSDRPSLR